VAFEGYAAMLKDPGIKDTLERANTDPASAFGAPRVHIDVVKVDF
jgi:hypothetical protein